MAVQHVSDAFLGSGDQKPSRERPSTLRAAARKQAA